MLVTLQMSICKMDIEETSSCRVKPCYEELFQKANIERKKGFLQDKSLFLCQYQLIIVPLHTILDWRVVRYHQSYWTQCLETDLFNMVVSLCIPAKMRGVPPFCNSPIPYSFDNPAVKQHIHINRYSMDGLAPTTLIT